MKAAMECGDSHRGGFDTGYGERRVATMTQAATPLAPRGQWVWSRRATARRPRQQGSVAKAVIAEELPWLLVACGG